MSETAKKLGLDKIPLAELVERAHNEIDALCNGKRWQMCIPVQADDSDIILGETLRAQDEVIMQLCEALADMVSLIEEHGDRVMLAHATRIIKARAAYSQARGGAEK
jgi:hypothetical protein